jgi:methylmalonyl-CoA mutase N-terminal domain/subunit
MNMLSGSPGMKAVERAVEKAILDEFREIESLGGVLAAVENRYQRSQIQNAAHRYEQQIYDGTRPIVGLNRYRNGADESPTNASELTRIHNEQFRGYGVSRSQRSHDH